MYAIIETGGKQYWIVPGEILQIEKLSASQGDEVTFNALWSASPEDTKQTQEKKSSAKVVAQVLRHLRGKKIIVFRKKPKKAYEKSRGHRQELTEIQIKDIQLS
ncbi:MAG: 50S ribosomal protein L21 [Elusimicrobia bacterium]|nr:50S ribosomal protein L21 [Elusimicrobiota bacterium]